MKPVKKSKQDHGLVFIGIDPGSTRAGYGLVKKSGNNFEYLSSGILSTSTKDKTDILVDLFSSLEKILVQFSPSAAGVEKLFFMKNVKTAIEVSQSRGVLLYCLRSKNIPVYEYAPTEVKQWLTGTGTADKKAMIRLVQATLHISDIHQPDDAYDALAMALMAAYASSRPW